MGSKHEPVGAYLVPEKIEELCDYINEHWNDASPVHLCAYALWRLNWIHPFTDGNGRTARAVSYMVLCLRLRCRLPGVNTIPDQISNNKKPYYKALESADKAFADGNIDLADLENYIAELLAGQLVSVHKEAMTSAKALDATSSVSGSEAKPGNRIQEKWSRGEIWAAIGVLVAALAVIMAALVVPEIRQWLRLDKPPSSAVDQTNAVPQNGTKLDLPSDLSSTAGPLATSNVDQQRPAHPLKVVDEDGKPIAGVEVLLLYPDGTHLKSMTSDAAGSVELGELVREQVAVYAAKQGWHSYYVPKVQVVKPLTIRMKPNPHGGSVIIDQTGYTPGLDGRLNPIRDSANRMYLYAANIAIEGGKPQPVSFTFNQPLRVKDSHRNVFELEFVAFLGSSALLDYRKVTD